MDADQTKSVVQEISGKVQKATGGLIGDSGVWVAGKVRELGGKAQQGYADTAYTVRDKTIDSPLTILGIAAGLGFLFGAIWGAANSTAAPNCKGRYPRDDQY